MIGLGVLLGLMALAAAWMIRTLLRRGSRRTDNVDGFLIERARTAQAATERTSYTSRAVHGSLTQGHQYRP